MRGRDPLGVGSNGRKKSPAIANRAQTAVMGRGRQKSQPQGHPSKESRCHPAENFQPVNPFPEAGYALVLLARSLAYPVSVTISLWRDPLASGSLIAA
jgi:hypothetical protein